MNTSVLSLIKALVIVAVFTIIGYIIYKNNQLAQNYESLSDRTQMFDFENYVDSVCRVIKNSTYSESSKMYNSLYEEIDVYSQICKYNGEKYIPQETSMNLFHYAFESFWSVFTEWADSLFRSSTWDERELNELKAEIVKIDKRQGVAHKDSLYNYQRYRDGYRNFPRLLNRLEHCKSEETYRQHANLKDYKEYPYCYLSDFQDRRENAKENAKKHWKGYILSEYQKVFEKANRIKEGPKKYSQDDVKSLDDDIAELKNKIESYRSTIGDEHFFETELNSLEQLFYEIL